MPPLEIETHHLEKAMPIRTLLIMLLLSLSACNKSDSTGTYVGGNHFATIILDIIEADNGKIDGSLGVAYFDQKSGEMKVASKVISGSTTGEKLSLVAHASEWGASDNPISLTREGDILVATDAGKIVSFELKKGTQEDYNVMLRQMMTNLTANDLDMFPAN